VKFLGIKKPQKARIRKKKGIKKKKKKKSSQKKDAREERVGGGFIVPWGSAKGGLGMDNALNEYIIR